MHDKFILLVLEQIIKIIILIVIGESRNGIYTESAQLLETVKKYRETYFGLK